MFTFLLGRARIEQLQGYREKGITTLEEANEFEAQKKRRTEEIAAKKHKEAAGYLYDTYNTKNGSNRERSNRYHNRAKDGDGLVTPGEGGKEEKEDQPLDLTDAPGVDLLSNEERELCSTLMMLPNYYLAVKNVMVQAFTKQGYLRKASANKLVTLETKRTEKVGLMVCYLLIAISAICGYLVAFHGFPSKMFEGRPT
ncbi:unnamed protein product [Choristocarpus tenellus]